MSSNVANNVPYLRTSRAFPSNPELLQTEINKAYVDTATAVNLRDIAIYDLAAIVTGQQWFGSTPQQKRQTFREVFQFSDSALTITHGITGIVLVTRLYGAFTDGTLFYTLPWVDVVAANNQINVYVSATQIVVTKGGGSPPAITSGVIVMEWLAQS